MSRLPTEETFPSTYFDPLALFRGEPERFCEEEQVSLERDQVPDWVKKLRFIPIVRVNSIAQSGFGQMIWRSVSMPA